MIAVVHGTVDDAELRHRLLESLEIEMGGHPVAVVHDAGPAKGRLAPRRRSMGLLHPTAAGLRFEHVWLG